MIHQRVAIRIHSHLQSFKTISVAGTFNMAEWQKIQINWQAYMCQAHFQYLFWAFGTLGSGLQDQ